MNLGSNSNKIWQPSIEPTNNSLPFPSSQHEEDQLYTKTSLRQEQDDDIRQGERALIVSSQAFNNTPKPFVRGSSQIFEIRGYQKINDHINSETNINQNQVQRARTISEQGEFHYNHDQQANTSIEEHKMAPPKLVHNQYNSPIDLYSMDNIRRTIEAHSEVLAPGVRGINFLKSNTHVNEQSEVYKLVMEEEQQQQQERQFRGSANASTCPVDQLSGSELANSQNLQQPERSYPRSWSSEDQNKSNSNHQANSTTQQQTSQCRPKCCECGQTILGAFAKIQNRFVHPQCFNCTTCGTSLKNSGYFTVNDKLYCEIHAKQVAKFMRIQYDFAAGKRIPDSQTQNVQHRSTPSRVGQDTNQSITSDQHSLSNVSRTTISTMFTNRAQPQLSGVGSGLGTRWNDPVGDKDGQLYPSDPCSSSSAANTGTFHVQSRQLALGGQHFTGHEESHIKTRQGQGSMQIGAEMSGRTPVCVHCQVSIHGPYVLAGKTTWCKVCSQTNFVCQSCHCSLLDIGFIEDGSNKYHCERCYEVHHAPICSKCSIKIKGDCLNALGKHWHPSCFVCRHCRQPFGNSSFYLEDNEPYCERDWNLLFTTKCYSCSYPIEAGDKWIEALGQNYHSACFKCSSCQAKLEGSTFYCKGGKPHCRLHAR